MPTETLLDEIVLFEIPTSASPRELLVRLRSSGGLVWLEPGEAVSVVGVRLGEDEGDLARVLRCAEAWADGRGLLALRFEVDGRTYVLRPAAGEPWSAL
jgi:hypothetical protein